MELFAKNRRGIYVYYKNHRELQDIEKYGNVITVSKKNKYVYLYVDESKMDKVITELNAKRNVKKIEISRLVDLSLTFERIDKNFLIEEE